MDEHRSLIACYYTEHLQELVVFATNALHGDRMAAEDMVQTVFEKLLVITQPILPDSLKALVYTMLRRQICDFWRRRQNEQLYEQTVRFTQPTTTNETFSVCSAHQINELLEHKLARMAYSASSVLRLHLYEGLSVSEIAQRLDINYKAAENRLGAGRREVRSYLRPLLAS